MTAPTNAPSLVSALTAMETFLAKDSDVVFLTLEVIPAGDALAHVHFGMVFMDQDDNGKHILTEPVDWDQLNLSDPLIADVNALHASLAAVVATPEGYEAVRKYLATARDVPALNISDVRNDLASLQDHDEPSTRASRPRPGR